jgi:hypothetical protein
MKYAAQLNISLEGNGSVLSIKKTDEVSSIAGWLKTCYSLGAYGQIGWSVNMTTNHYKMWR